MLEVNSELLCICWRLASSRTNEVPAVVVEACPEVSGRIALVDDKLAWVASDRLDRLFDRIQPTLDDRLLLWRLSSLFAGLRVACGHGWSVELGALTFIQLLYTGWQRLVSH